MSTEVRLEKLVFAYSEIFSYELLDSSVSIDRLVDGFRLTLKGYLWGEHLEKRTIRYPTSWWEAFKERWFPVFVLRWFPISYTVVRIEGKVVYPDLKIALPKDRHFLVLQPYGHEELHKQAWRK